MKKFLVLVLFLMFTSSVAADITVICTTPTTNTDGTALTDLAGIRWHQRLSTVPTYSTVPSGVLVTSTTNTNVSWTLVTSQTVTYCFVAYAYDTSANLSGPSNEVCKLNVDRVIPSPPALRISTILLTPTSFITTTVGTSRYRAFKVQNTTSVPMIVTSTELLGPDPYFRLYSYVYPRTVQPLATANIRVYFEPVDRGTWYTVMRVNTDAGFQDIPVSGNGI